MFSWAWHSTPERESLVTVSLKPDGDGTLLTFHHEQFARRGRPRRPRARLDRFARQARKIRRLNALERSLPCNRTRSSRARNGSQPARPTWRMRRNSRRRATALSEERRDLPWVKVDKDYVFDGPDGKVTLADLFKGAQPARGAALHVCARLGRGLQELLVLGRRFRAHGPASRRARHHAGRDLARAARKSSTRSRSGWAGPSTGSRPANNDFNYDYARFVHARADRVEVKRNTISAPRRSMVTKCPVSACSIATRRDVFHTYSSLRARPRHDECRLSLSRSDAARPSRRRSALSDGLGAAA